MAKTRLSGRFEYPKVEGLRFDAETRENKDMTQQHFAKEADVNNIMARYTRTGVLTSGLPVSGRQPTFGDFSSADDFQALQNKLVMATNSFCALSSDVRAKFHNSIPELLDFVSNPENKAEAEKLGLLPVSAVPPVPATPAASVPAAPAAPQGGSSTPSVT